MAENENGDDEFFEEGDDSLEFDWNDVEEASFEPLPAGVYTGTITENEFKLSSNGNPMWSTIITVTDGEFENRKIFHNFVFTEKAKPFAKKHLAQIAPEIFDGQFNPSTMADVIVGKEVRMNVKIRKNVYQGETRLQNNINAFLPLEEAFIDG